MRLSERNTWLLDCTLIFLLTSLLVAPLYKLVYLDNWASIESTFIADGRMLMDNLPHRHWQPLWYCGTRADYVYPPGLRYGVAILMKALNTSPPRAYHIYIAFFYCLGIMAVYVLIRTGNRTRWTAWLGAAGVALLSPSFVFIPQYRADSFWGAPQRLHALMSYGEGPHISALSVLPFVLAFALIAFRRFHPAYLALSAIAAALVVTNNFYGATALAILFPILVWTAWLTFGPRQVLWQAAAIAAIAYGLTASWLVPSYFRVTSQNLSLVAEPGNLRSVIILVVVTILFCAGTRYAARRSKNDRCYEMFVFGSVLFMCLYILGRRYFGFQVAGETGRLAPELDLVLILAAVELLRFLSKWEHRRVPTWVPRTAVALLAIYGLSFSARYLKYAWKEFPFDHNWRDRPEYKTTKWLWEHHPNKRVLVTGSIRFWYNTWFDGAQVDGGSQQGLLNHNIVASQWRLFGGDNGELIRTWLVALAADIAVIPQRESKEHYHDVEKLALWHSVFPLMRDDGEGNYFYRIPRRCEGTVRLVDLSGMHGLAPMPSEGETEALTAYVNAIEAEPATPDGCGRIRSARENTDVLNIEGNVAPGEGVLVQETFDPAWRAYANGRLAPIERDPMNFMLVRTGAGRQQIRLVFETPLEVRFGYGLSLIAILCCAMLIARGVRARSKSVPQSTPLH